MDKNIIKALEELGFTPANGPHDEVIFKAPIGVDFGGIEKAIIAGLAAKALHNEIARQNGTLTGRIDSSEENKSNVPKSDDSALALGHIVHQLVEQVAKLSQDVRFLYEDHRDLAERVTKVELSSDEIEDGLDIDEPDFEIPDDDDNIWIPEFNKGEFFQFGVDGHINYRLNPDEVQELVEDVALSETVTVQYADRSTGNTLVFKIVEPNGDVRYVVAQDYHEVIVTKDGELL